MHCALRLFKLPRSLLGYLVSTFILGVASASQPSSAEFTISEIADGIFVHVGQHAGLEHPGRGDSANIGFIVGGECIAVIDTGGSVATGRALRVAIEARSQIPICYVINTHVHFDHVLGNAAFVSDTTKFVGHHNLADAIAANREFFAEQFPAELENGNAANVVAPTMLVENTLDLDLGDRKLVLEAQATAHTNADLTVHDQKTNTLFTGDLVFMERLPILDGSLKGWIAWLDTHRGETIARIVPGHGPSSAPWPSGGEHEGTYLNRLLRDGREAVREGVFLEDAIDTMSRDAAATWSLNERHSRNVSKAFRELEWE